jgi:hypothetical protein
MRFTVAKGLAKLGWFLPILLSLGAAGCGASTGTVSGKVYHKNTLLKGGTVTFVSADKQFGQTATFLEDGSYTIDQLPPGEMTIGVQTSSLNPAKQTFIPKNAMPKDVTEGSDYQPTDPSVLARRYVAIPERFADPETSGLKCKVQTGKQEHDIHLE